MLFGRLELPVNAVTEQQQWYRSLDLKKQVFHRCYLKIQENYSYAGSLRIGCVWFFSYGLVKHIIALSSFSLVTITGKLLFGE